ncbi:MAG: SDR family oxidoreductase [Planctomycetota bacterium]
MNDSRVLLVTGASSGIGAATAKAAVDQGLRVVLAARRKDRLDALASELGADRAVAVACDVTDFDQQQATVRAALEHFGRLDAVLANAGFGAKRGFLEESVEHWRAMVDTNVTGCAFTIRSVLPTLLEQGHGHVLLLGSVAGRRVLPGSLYSATTWAVAAMGEGLRQELRQIHENTKIKVTVIAPGAVATPFFDQPPKGAMQPEDVARAVLYALEQPAHVDINEVLLRPADQAV